MKEMKWFNEINERNWHRTCENFQHKKFMMLKRITSVSLYRMHHFAVHATKQCMQHAHKPHAHINKHVVSPPENFCPLLLRILPYFADLSNLYFMREQLTDTHFQDYLEKTRSSEFLVGVRCHRSLRRKLDAEFAIDLTHIYAIALVYECA
jgi:hypothetical protein